VCKPMGGSAGPKIRGGRNAPDELLAVLDVPVVVSWVFVLPQDLPAEKTRVELAGASLVGRVEIAPAERAGGSRDAGAGIYGCLPDGKCSSGGVLNDGHAAGISDVKRSSEDLAAELGRTRGRGVCVLHGDVHAPVRPNAVLKLFGAKLAGCG